MTDTTGFIRAKARIYAERKRQETDVEELNRLIAERKAAKAKT